MWYNKFNMKHLNIEIKAKSDNHSKIREILISKSARHYGIDHQIDTYFKSNVGRLKLREGNLENYLVYYERDNQEGPKQSLITLFECLPKSSLKSILIKSLGILVVVDKVREIYFIDNVKFHIDTVEGLGKFIEIEAIDDTSTIEKSKLLEQCQFYLDLFKIEKKDLISCSYSDLILNLE